MDSAELAFAGLARQAELVREKEVSPRELVEVCLERIARIDPALRSFRVVFAERAVVEAKQASARRRANADRPLLGVPVAIKDGYDVAGETTTLGTGAVTTPAAEDCEFVRRLRAAGAIVIGKTTLPELAMFAFSESPTWGVTRNPWALDRVPGGSSGGSAAAVAAGLVGAASASDGAGSIRIPAACCGLFGLKPQRNRVTLAPHVEHWHGLSALGTVTRTVADTALYLDVTAGPAPTDLDVPPPLDRPFSEAASAEPGRLRIAVSTKPPAPGPVDKEIKAAVESTAELLRGLGHEVRESHPDYGVIFANAVVRYFHGIREDAREIEHPPRLARRTKTMARIGALLPESSLRWARESEAAMTARLNTIFDDHDVLLTPVMAKRQAEVGQYEGRGALATMLDQAARHPFTGPWNVTGQPTASVPAGFASDGLPLAVQLIAPPNREDVLLSLAAQIERARPWADARPPVG